MAWSLKRLTSGLSFISCGLWFFFMNDAKVCSVFLSREEVSPRVYNLEKEWNNCVSFQVHLSMYGFCNKIYSTIFLWEISIHQSEEIIENPLYLFIKLKYLHNSSSLLLCHAYFVQGSLLSCPWCKFICKFQSQYFYHILSYIHYLFVNSLNKIWHINDKKKHTF